MYQKLVQKMCKDNDQMAGSVYNKHLLWWPFSLVCSDNPKTQRNPKKTQGTSVSPKKPQETLKNPKEP